jgi:hypothetical protein
MNKGKQNDRMQTLPILKAKPLFSIAVDKPIDAATIT